MAQNEAPPSHPRPEPLIGEAPDATRLEQLRAEVPGASARSPVQLPWRAWWAVLKRVWIMNDFHNLPLLAAGVAFFAFLAFVPLIAVVVLLYGLIGDPGTVADNLVLIDGFVPPEVLAILQKQMLDIVTTSKTQQGIGLALAIGLSLYGATRSAKAMMKALNIIYEEAESRSIVRVTLVSIAITLGMAMVAIIGIVAISFFSYVSIFLKDYIGNSTRLLIQILTWLLAGILISGTFAIFFRFAPDRRAARWSWLSTGAVFATLSWVAITLGFGFYASNITDYNATYGSLAAVVIFLMWLFLSAYVVLIGAEINAETERQTFEDSTVGSEQPIGSRGAVMADTVILDRAKRAILEKRQRRRANRLARWAK